MTLNKAIEELLEELSNPSLTEEEKKALQKYQNWLLSIKTTTTNNKECSTLNWNEYPKVKPKEEGSYLCTVKSLFKDGKNYVEILSYRNKKGNLFDDEWSGKGFYKYDSEYGDFKIPDVIAWMELAEPYEEEYDNSPVIEFSEEAELSKPIVCEGVDGVCVGIPEEFEVYRDKIKSVIIPNSTTEISKGAFLGCKSLTSITIPNSVIYIDYAAFKGCESLTLITIPDSVTYIDNAAFADCKSLTSIIVPDSITEISDFAFAVCYNLTSITIPSSVTKIGYAAFYRCDNLKSITVSKDCKVEGQGGWEGEIIRR